MALTEYGPYYIPALRSYEGQRRAIGMEPFTPSQMAAMTYGELMSRYQEARSRRKEQRVTELEERGMTLQEQTAAQTQAYQRGMLGVEEQRTGILRREAKTAAGAAKMGGIAGLTGAGVAVAPYAAKAVPAVIGGAKALTGIKVAGAGAAGAGGAVATGALVGGAAEAAAVGGGAMAGLAPTLGMTAETLGVAVPAGAEAGAIGGVAGVGAALGPVGIIAALVGIGALLAFGGGEDRGCCFTFLEGEMLTYNVRQYRDSHYNKITSPVAWGYRRMSMWLVPLMKKHKLIKSFVKWIMLKPLANFADWYYEDNWYGWVFYPLKEFWTNFWRTIGLMKGDI